MKLGLALAGGGVRGAAHLGVIQALEEHGIVFDCYAGTSAGSIVAALKALGHTNSEIFGIIKQIDNSLFDVDVLGILKGLFQKFHNLDSLMKGNRLRNFLNDHLAEIHVEDVKTPLGIVSTNLDTGAQVIFTSVKIGDASRIDDHVEVVNQFLLQDAVYASSALPAIFRPLPFNGSKLVDGCLVNNMPADVLKAMGAEKIIAVDLTYNNETRDTKGVFAVIDQMLNIMMEQNVDISLEEAQDVIYLNPEIFDISALEFDKAYKCYERGYEYGKSIVDEVLKELEGQS